jgi:hypothetical protein
MGIDHSIKHRKISRVSLEGTLHRSITLLEKKKGINSRKETMPIDRHIHYSKLVVNPRPLLMSIYIKRIDMAIRYSLNGKHGKETIIPIPLGLHMVM